MTICWISIGIAIEVGIELSRDEVVTVEEHGSTRKHNAQEDVEYDGPGLVSLLHSAQTFLLDTASNYLLEKMTYL